MDALEITKRIMYGLKKTSEENEFAFLQIGDTVFSSAEKVYHSSSISVDPSFPGQSFYVCQHADKMGRQDRDRSGKVRECRRTSEEFDGHSIGFRLSFLS